MNVKSIIILSCSKYKIWQFVFSVILRNYSDDDSQNDWNILVINNMWYNTCYT